jgi:hypothetical protein
MSCSFRETTENLGFCWILSTYLNMNWIAVWETTQLFLFELVHCLISVILQILNLIRWCSILIFLTVCTFWISCTDFLDWFWKHEVIWKFKEYLRSLRLLEFQISSYMCVCISLVGNLCMKSPNFIYFTCSVLIQFTLFYTIF